MTPTTNATTRAADTWQSYLVAEDWHRFSAGDHNVWDRLFDRQVALLRGRVVSAFDRGVRVLGLDAPGIPRLGELSRRLLAASGWRLVSVAGIVPDGAFFAMLRERVFPIGNFIRSGHDLDYLEEPDCFHDIFGHVPTLADPTIGDLMQHLGAIGVEACEAGHADTMSRLYWHTIEFGLAREDGIPRIWGAGLASSFGEARFALDGDVPRPRFTVEDAAGTAYRSDRFQPLYFVSDSIEAAAADLERLDAAAVAALGGAAGGGYAPTR